LGLSRSMHILRWQHVVAFEGFARTGSGRWACFVEKLSRSPSDWRQLESPSPSGGCLATLAPRQAVGVWQPSLAVPSGLSAKAQEKTTCKHAESCAESFGGAAVGTDFARLYERFEKSSPISP
jgi:hypothetical protein